MSLLLLSTIIVGAYIPILLMIYQECIRQPPPIIPVCANTLEWINQCESIQTYFHSPIPFESIKQRWISLPIPWGLMKYIIIEHHDTIHILSVYIIWLSLFSLWVYVMYFMEKKKEEEEDEEYIIPYTPPRPTPWVHNTKLETIHEHPVSRGVWYMETHSPPLLQARPLGHTTTITHQGRTQPKPTRIPSLVLTQRKLLTE